MASKTASKETAAVEEKVSDLEEMLSGAVSESGRGSVFKRKQPNPRKRHQKHDLMIFLSSGERVLVEVKRSSPSGTGADESRWGVLFDIVAELFKSSLTEEMSMERARGELSPGEAEALRRGGVDLQAKSVSPSTLVSSFNEWRKLAQASYTTAQIAKLMKVNDSRIRQRLGGSHPSLYGFQRGKSWLIPKFQIENRHAIPGLALVVSRLDRSLHPVSVARWFQTPNPDLVHPSHDEEILSPIDWLRTGGSPEAAADLAAML